MAQLSIGNKAEESKYLGSDNDPWTLVSHATTVGRFGVQVRESQYSDNAVGTWGGAGGSAKWGATGASGMGISLVPTYHTSAQIASKSGDTRLTGGSYNEQRHWFETEIRDASGGALVHVDSWEASYTDRASQTVYTGYVDPGDYDCVGMVCGTVLAGDSWRLEAISVSGAATNNTVQYAKAVAGNNWTRFNTFLLPARSSPVRAQAWFNGTKDMCFSIMLLGVYTPAATTGKRRPSGLIIP